MMETPLATLLAATSCSWHIGTLAVAPPSVSLQVRPSQTGSSPSVRSLSTWTWRRSHSSLTTSKWTQVDPPPRLEVSSHFFVFVFVFTLRHTFHLPGFCSFSPYQPGSHFPFFLFFLTSSLGHVPFPFISSTFFSHAKTPAFSDSAPPPPNTNSCYAFALIIPQTRRADECRLHLAPRPQRP